MIIEFIRKYYFEIISKLEEMDKLERITWIRNISLIGGIITLVITVVIYYGINVKEAGDYLNRKRKSKKDFFEIISIKKSWEPEEI